MGAYKIIDQYASHFVTFTVVGWIDIFSRLECKEVIIGSLRYCIENKGLHVHAYVIMGSHLHLVVSAAENSKGLSNIIRDFKRHTSKELFQWFNSSRKESRKDWLPDLLKTFGSGQHRVEEYQIWQHNSHPKECVYPRYTKQKIDYIHNNPVAAGIVSNPEHFRYSSAGFYGGESDVVLVVDPIRYGSLEGLVYP